MRRTLWSCLPLFALLLLPLAARAQMGSSSATPMALDFKKVAVGSWAEYNMAAGPAGNMKMRWALVARDAKGPTMEMSMEGGAMAMMGGKVVMRAALANELGTPPRQIVVQMGANDPMEMSPDMPGMPKQRFEKPDPKKLVGKESVTVPAGTFKAGHYRDVTPQATQDYWLSEDVPPLGLVKIVITPKPGTPGPGGQPQPPVSMELTAKGKGAKPEITKPAKPFDPSKMGGGGPRHGGAPPPGAAPKK
jgi:hypothetical protein